MIAQNGVLEMTLRLHPTPVTLDPVTITGAWTSRNRTRYERRRRSEVTGQFADGRKLARVRIARSSMRLQVLFPRILSSPQGVVRVRMRGVDINGSATCQPRIIIDGMRYPGDLSVDALISGPEIRAVEFYPDALFAPGDLAFGYDRMIVGGKETLSKPCAVIVIWTHSGFGESGS